MLPMAETAVIPATVGEHGQIRSRDLGPGAPPGWSWRKGLTQLPPNYSPIVPRSVRNGVELSFGQQRLWFVAQLDSGSAAYNVPMAWRVTGTLDVAALQRSLQVLVQRHEALRTAFPSQQGHPLQFIAPPQSFPLAMIDLRRGSMPERESELERQLQEEIRRPFDLASGPVIRAALFRLDDHDHVLALTLHHIVCDGPSIAVLLEELSLAYSGFSRGLAMDLPQPAVQYADFALWQREALIPEVRQDQLVYWKQQLCDAPAALDFPLDHPRPATATFRGGMERRQLSKTLSDAFRSLARRHGVTRFMALLAAFQALLYRYTGQEEVVVGSPMTHRNRAEAARAIGFFANMMALRTPFHGDLTFRELLKKVREVSLGAYAHQDLPFEQLVAALKPERTAARNPFFQAMLTVEEASWHDLELAGLRSLTLPVHNGAAKFDLNLGVVDRPDGFQLALEYNSDLLEAETARTVLQHYENLVRAAVADPDGRVSMLPVLAEAERQRILVEWNDTRQDYARDTCVHQLFEAQVERTPNAVAVKFQTQQLTYRELNERANRLARHLTRLGVGPEDLVGLCLERSLDLVVAILGVLKAGGAYLPLDPAHPSQRRAAILQDSRAKVLLTQEARLQDFHPVAIPAVVRLDADWIKIAREPGENLSPVVRPNNLAYVIYTSGSTGQPKGVQIEHRSVVNFLSAMRTRPGISAADTLLAVTTISFDIAALELLLPLTTGARVVIASRDDLTDGRRLQALLAQCGATIMQATPATWQMLLAAGWQGTQDLKLLCGGEALAPALARQLLTRCASLWNLYGPTETTIWSAVHKLDHVDDSAVPIGRPLANTQMYVLDSHLQPVPVGVVGELYIGGDGVARGYLGLPQRTAERFIPDPFAQPTGPRLYRTGDLVRQLPNGTFKFEGREDRQAKIRGYRIEPAEIESRLTRHPAVQQATVVLFNDVSGEKRLVAYVVPSNPAGLKDQEFIPALRTFLRQKLPEYMVPSAFVALDNLPLTANGKLDWKALPAPGDRPSATAFVAPRDSVESRLVKIWEKTLGMQTVGVTDNFFDLGGHSVLGASLFASIEKEFARALPMSLLFEASTIEKLASILRQQQWSPPWLVQIQVGDPSNPPFILVQARMGYRALAAELGSDQPVYVVPYDNLFESQTEPTLPEIAATLVGKIREFQPHGPYYLGGMCLAGRVAFAIARQLHLQKQEVALLAIFDSPAPGYPAPSSTRIWAQHLAWHVRQFLRAEGKQKFVYLVDRLRTLRWHLTNRLWRTSYRLFRRLRRPLPRILRDPLRLMGKAVITDALDGRYPGRIALFRPADRPSDQHHDAALGWELVANHVEVFDIPGDHKHVLLPPYVSWVGQRLKACLKHS